MNKNDEEIRKLLSLQETIRFIRYCINRSDVMNCDLEDIDDMQRVLDFFRLSQLQIGDGRGAIMVK